MNKVVYLSKEDTHAFLRNDDDGYVLSLTIPDLYARNVKSHNEYIEQIIRSATDFNESQKILLDTSTEKADAFLKTVDSVYIDNKLMANISWKFALTIDNLYENGYPHTRKDIIFISPSLLTSPDLVKTLIHEKIHIYQRKHLIRFQQTLIDNGYRIMGKRKNVKNSRSNPDLDQYFYKDPNGKTMLSLYKTSTPTSITDTLQSDETAEHPFEKIAYIVSSDYGT